MASALISAGKGNGSTNASTTAYLGLYEGACGSANQATEANVQVAYRSPGTLSLLHCIVATNTRGTSTVTLRKNGANGNQSVSIGASATGQFTDVSHTDSVATGDKIDAQVSTGSGGSSFVIETLGVVFAATTGTVKRHAAASPGGSNIQPTGSATVFFVPSGDTGAGTATEANVQFKAKAAATLQNLFVYVSANGRSTATTFGSRKNGANGNLSVSVGASASGAFEDVTDTDSLAVGDLFNYYCTTGTGSGTLTLFVLSCEVSTTNSQFHLIGASTNAATVVASVTTYFPAGGLLLADTVEANLAQNANVALTLSNLEAYVSANTVTATSTIRLRKNSANATQALSIGASATGYFEDVSDVDGVGTSDTINYQVIAGPTGTQITLYSIGMLATAGPASPTDTATLSDTSGSSIGVGTPADSGTASESGALGLGTTDAGTVAEGQSSLGVSAVVEPVTEAETPTSTAAVTASDSAQDLDQAAQSVASTISPAGGGYGSFYYGQGFYGYAPSNAGTQIFGVDNPSVAESAASTAADTATDSATETDTASGVNVKPPVDTGTVNETPFAAVNVTAPEQATETEQPAIATSSTDTATLGDTQAQVIPTAGGVGGGYGSWYYGGFYYGQGYSSSLVGNLNTASVEQDHLTEAASTTASVATAEQATLSPEGATRAQPTDSATLTDAAGIAASASDVDQAQASEQAKVGPNTTDSASVVETPAVQFFMVSPTPIPSNTGPQTLTLTGQNTNWKGANDPNATTFTIIEQGATVTGVSGSVSSPTSAVIQLTTGPGTGSLLISDGVNSYIVPVGPGDVAIVGEQATVVVLSSTPDTSTLQDKASTGTSVPSVESGTLTEPSAGVAVGTSEQATVGEQGAIGVQSTESATVTEGPPSAIPSTLTKTDTDSGTLSEGPAGIAEASADTSTVGDSTATVSQISGPSTQPDQGTLGEQPSTTSSGTAAETGQLGESTANATGDVDAATVSESPSANVQANAAETGTLGEQVSGAAQTADADSTATLGDTGAGAAKSSASDTAGETPTVSESASSTAQVNRTDSAGLGESSSSSASVGATESASETEAVGVSAQTTDVDSATAAEQVSSSATLTAAEQAALAEQVAAAVSANVTDQAALVEQLQLALSATDSATLSDTLANALQIAISTGDTSSLQDAVNVALAVAVSAAREQYAVQESAAVSVGAFVGPGLLTLTDAPTGILTLTDASTGTLSLGDGPTAR